MNPGIRKTVAFLNERGFETTDSGDGKTHDFACDRDHPYVVIKTEPGALVFDARLLLSVLGEAGVQFHPIGPEPGPSIQATFDPADGTAFIDLLCVDDELLFGSKP